MELEDEYKDEDEEYDGEDYDFLSSMTSFMNILAGYDTVELMNDFLHIKNTHFYGDKKRLQRHINSIIPDQCEYDEQEDIICQYADRIYQNNEIYKFSQEHDDLDIIELYNLNLNHLEYASLDEMMEINLQNYLDMIHSTLLHECVSNGDKYISKIPESYDNKIDKSGIVDVGNYEFGLFFNYWSKNNDHYCCPKYSNLKTELLNNELYSISLNDYILIENKANDFLNCNYGKNLRVKREFQWMKSSKDLKIGDKITMDHLIALITYCNYDELREEFIYACSKCKKVERDQDVKKRNQEITNWCRLLMESVYCFGDVLKNEYDHNDNKENENDDDEEYKLYHSIDCKLSFERMDFQFDLPVSMTKKLDIIVRNKHNLDDSNDITLQLEKMYNKDICNFYLDVSNLSQFPVESECIVFGAKLGCTDIIYDGLSHNDYVMSLRLYQKIICGEWFNNDKYQLLHDKYQRRIMKMANSMINARYFIF